MNEQKCLDCGKFLSKAGTLVCSVCTQKRIDRRKPRRRAPAARY